MVDYGGGVVVVTASSMQVGWSCHGRLRWWGGGGGGGDRIDDDGGGVLVAAML